MIIYAIITLGSIGAIGAIILYFVSVRFNVKEAPFIESINEILPGANCGGCGFPGCRAFAVACVNAEFLDELFCPAGGSKIMTRVASILGKETNAKETKIAVIRCTGSHEVRPRRFRYDGARNCATIALIHGGDTDCHYGCFGFGDCVKTCVYNAISVNPLTEMAEINEDRCTSCGACLKSCPTNIIEIRKKGADSHRIYVACVNKDMGAIARKACANACIGCGKCLKACVYDAITINDHVAYIDDTKCRLCSRCIAACPTHAIREVIFPSKDEPQTVDNA